MDNDHHSISRCGKVEALGNYLVDDKSSSEVWRGRRKYKVSAMTRGKGELKKKALAKFQML